MLSIIASLPPRRGVTISEISDAIREDGFVLDKMRIRRCIRHAMAHGIPIVFERFHPSAPRGDDAFRYWWQPTPAIEHIVKVMYGVN